MVDLVPTIIQYISSINQSFKGKVNLRQFHQAKDKLVTPSGLEYKQQNKKKLMVLNISKCQQLLSYLMSTTSIIFETNGLLFF